MDEFLTNDLVPDPENSYTSSQTYHTILTFMFIGGSRGGRAGHTPPPTGPNSFIFTYIFTEKHLRQGIHTLPNGSTPPLLEILDPPLMLHTLTKNC